MASMAKIFSMICRRYASGRAQVALAPLSMGRAECRMIVPRNSLRRMAGWQDGSEPAGIGAGRTRSTPMAMKRGRLPASVCRPSRARRWPRKYRALPGSASAACSSASACDCGVGRDNRPVRSAGVPHQPGVDALDDDLIRRYADGTVGAVGRQQDNLAVVDAQLLDRDIAVMAGDDDLARFGGGLLLHRDQIVVVDALVDHGVAAYAQQIVRAQAEQRRRHVDDLFRVLDGLDGRAGGDAAEARQADAAHQLDVAIAAGAQADVALALQRAEMAGDSVGRAKAEGPPDFRHRWRALLLFDRLADEGQDVGLAGRTFCWHDT